MVEHLLIDTGIAQGIPYSKYPNLDTILICIVSIFRRGNKPVNVQLFCLATQFFAVIFDNFYTIKFKFTHSSVILLLHILILAP